MPDKAVCKELWSIIGDASGSFLYRETRGEAAVWRLESGLPRGRETRRVPILLVKLRDARDRVVFESEIVPPKRTLTPGEKVTVQAGMSDIPRSARYAEFGWKPD